MAMLADSFLTSAMLTIVLPIAVVAGVGIWWAVLVYRRAK
jgi:hypothetical protein